MEAKPGRPEVKKELVYARTVHPETGSPVCYLAALQNIDNYGDANASNIKLAIDDAFLKKLKLPRDLYITKQISATADGAEVNFGQYSGVLTQMKNDSRPWLLPIHCVSHKVELGIKDSTKKIKEFEQVQQLMVTVYYTMKTSGKFQRHFYETAEILNVQVYRFGKVLGTRFVNHNRNGVQTLLNNYIPLILAIENSIAHNPNRSISAKLRAMLKKLKDPNFLAAACLYKQLLDTVATLSLLFEQNDVLAYQVMPAVEATISRLETILTKKENVLELEEFTFTGQEIQKVLSKPGHIKRKSENREHVQVRYSAMNSV